LCIRRSSLWLLYSNKRVCVCIYHLSITIITTIVTTELSNCLFLMPLFLHSHFMNPVHNN